jgi:hypothetical protein
LAHLAANLELLKQGWLFHGFDQRVSEKENFGLV